MKDKKLVVFITIGIVTLLLAGVFSQFASPHPDGLERVAINTGIMEKESTIWEHGLFPDYEMRSSSRPLATGLVGIAGALIMFGVLFIVGKLLVKDTGNR